MRHGIKIFCAKGRKYFYDFFSIRKTVKEQKNVIRNEKSDREIIHKKGKLKF